MRLNSLLQDAEFWRARAEQTRSLVQGIVDLKASAILLRVAAEYDRLAKYAEDLVQRGGHALGSEGDCPAG